MHTINAASTAFPLYSLTEFGGKLYFAANDGTHGTELWAHDGTTTSMVADLVPGVSGTIGEVLVWNGALYLNATAPGLGPTLFKFTGTSGVQNVHLDGEVKVHPNPSADVWHFGLSLRSATALSVTISDATGRVVSATQLRQYPAGQSELEQSAARLPPGTYYYRLSDAQSRVMSAGKLQKL